MIPVLEYDTAVKKEFNHDRKFDCLKQTNKIFIF